MHFVCNPNRNRSPDVESLYLLIPLSVVLVFGIGIAFWWSLRNGQFDDLEGPAHRVLMDDDKTEQSEQER